jgi:UDP-glucose 4-epimerase
VWRSRRVLVTGGLSFIGSHLVDTLLEKGAEVQVADDFSSGSMTNLEYRLKKTADSTWSTSLGDLQVFEGDLKDRGFTRSVLKGCDTVFHLAALHGGRGYINSHPAQCCSNMIIDQLVFEEVQRAGVGRVCYASSACVYPAYLQDEAGSSYLLREEDADPFTRDKAQADLEYGWAKLMGEMALRAYHRQYGLKSSAVRIFTAYGPRENETHAIIALIAKAFVRMDPFVVWGTGQQDRNFTFVQDIVDAMLLAAEKIEDGSSVNAGRSDRLTISQACELVFKLMSWRPTTVRYDLSKPQGVASRAASVELSRRVLGWEPRVTYEEGFGKTIDWYAAHRDPKQVRTDLDRLLTER